MLIPNVCTHNHGYNRFSQNKLYINISQCDHANTSCVFAPWWLEETLFGFSWDRESEECRHQAAHAPPLNENFHFKRCGIPTCLSISVLSTVTWYSFLAQTYTKTVSWAYHKSPLVSGFLGRMWWNLANYTEGDVTFITHFNSRILYWAASVREAFLNSNGKILKVAGQKVTPANVNLILVNAPGNFIQWIENKILNGNKRHVSVWLWWLWTTFNIYWYQVPPWLRHKPLQTADSCQFLTVVVMETEHNCSSTRTAEVKLIQTVHGTYTRHMGKREGAERETS